MHTSQRYQCPHAKQRSACPGCGAHTSAHLPTHSGCCSACHEPVSRGGAHAGRGLTGAVRPTGDQNPHKQGGAAARLPALLLAQRADQVGQAQARVQQQQRHLGRMPLVQLDALHADQRARVALVLEVDWRLACATSACVSTRQGWTLGRNWYRRRHTPRRAPPPPALLSYCGYYQAFPEREGCSWGVVLPQAPAGLSIWLQNASMRSTQLHASPQTQSCQSCHRQALPAMHPVGNRTVSSVHPANACPTTHSLCVATRGMRRLPLRITGLSSMCSRQAWSRASVGGSAPELSSSVK